jgi:catechol 2,3-dioxygenase-like lactoylglutathione lyase family enzyme
MALQLTGLTPLLMVYDMPTSLRFYRDVLGFEIVSTSPALGGPDCFHWVWLRSGDAAVMLNTAYEFDEERPAIEEAARILGHKDLGLFIGCPDVDAAYRDLLDKGLSLKKPQVARYGMKQLSFNDPDGYVITLQWRAEADAAQK